MIKHRLSPSLIARFFYHNCERYLRYHSTPLQERARSGIPEVRPDQSPATKALLEAGNRWEELVVLEKLKDNLLVPEGEGVLHERAHSVKESLEIFRNLKKGDTVYQPTLLVPPRFYQKYNLSPELCRFSACRPDLLRVVEKEPKKPTDLTDPTDPTNSANMDNSDKPGESGELCLQVIDVKASDELSSSHRIQATLYALMLKEVLEENGIDMQVDMSRAGIWLYGQDEPELFNLGFNIRIIEEFLRYRLPKILAEPLKDVPWHVYNRCELCDFYRHCREEAEKCDSVSLIPYLSVSGREYLREAEWDSRTSINTLSELEAFLEAGGSEGSKDTKGVEGSEGAEGTENVDEILDKCGSLRGKGEFLRNTLRALKEKEVVVNRGVSLPLPKNEDVSLFLTLQRDPVSGKIYSAGFRRFKGKAVYGSPVNERVYVAESPDHCEEIQRRFLLDLFDELKILHDYNEAFKEANESNEVTGNGSTGNEANKTNEAAANEPTESDETLKWKEQKSLQTYVYDSYEASLFRELLREAVKIPELAPVALELLFYYQDPSLFGEKQHPFSKVSFPLVVLTEEIRKLVCLPIPFSLRLPEVTEALPKADFDFKLDPGDLFWFEHGNALKSDAIAMAWERKKVEAVGWIEKELSMRLLAASSVLDGLREKTRDSLVRWPPKFRIPASRRYNYPEVSRMVFITRYESYLRNQEIRERRSLPFSERVKEGISIPVQYLEQNLWKVNCDLDTSLFEQNENFGYLLVPKGADGEKAQLSFEDYKYRTNLQNPGRSKVCFAMVNKKVENEKTGKIMGFFLEVYYNEDQLGFSSNDARAASDPSSKPVSKQSFFKTGDEAVLHPRFTDFSSERIISRLTELDEQLEHDFIRLLRDPRGFSTPIRETDSVRTAALKHAENSGFTPSQQKAFTHMLENRLTLIWGPPGTGKTYFLAKALLDLVRAKMEAGETIHVGITAFTHAAIENLLLRVREFAEEEGLVEGSGEGEGKEEGEGNGRKEGKGKGLEIYKLKDIKTQKAREALKVLSEYDIQEKSTCPFLILGGTVNSFNKIKQKCDPFDILIVDEASQMKPAELALGMSVLDEGKRLILAGDDLQLPPIIAGEYPEPEDGLPGLYDSIFSYLRLRDSSPDPGYTCQLLENWRMNETLSSFPAATLYGKGYRPANEGIAKQKLKLLSRGFPETTQKLEADAEPESVSEPESASEPEFASEPESEPKLKPEPEPKPESNPEPEPEFINWALDSEYPLSVVILENTRASIENEIEAELVAKLAVSLRQTLSRDDAGTPYPDSGEGDSDFWKHGLFIVSPHRAQIRTIRDELGKLRDWQHRPFVDTVDKTQGQEAEAVIVSYGVSDIDTAMNEAEFIYSLNRLNVSITRAKAKCVVFLPRPLLEPPLDLLKNAGASKGLGHMLELVEFCREKGEVEEFEVELEQGVCRLTGIRAKANRVED
ncbi:AAA domain-containing protein [Methanosarcina sp. Mfa9]|uniref:bifunctional RecB family nuclease/DEAD/DEAH box helicase n=1 Tax=Methanosarcina sp. Mfa9 TaxID=3439063 RepID=UPI003F838239